MLKIEANGVDLHYVEHGPGAESNPPTAVLLHGFTPDHRLMTGCFEPVFACRPDWRRVYFDLPGMGQTPAPAHFRSTDDVFETVLRGIEQLVPDGRYAVCGESYGGYLARGLAAAEPDRVAGLALVCPMIIATHADRDVPDHAVLVRDDELRASPDSEFNEIAVVQTRQTSKRTQAEIVSGLDIADTAALDRIREDWAGTFEKEPRTFDRPTLFLTGRQDSSTGYRDAWNLLERYPRATFAVMDRAGHNAHIEQPDLFNALVSEWLDRVKDETAREA